MAAVVSPGIRLKQPSLLRSDSRSVSDSMEMLALPQSEADGTDAFLVEGSDVLSELPDRTSILPPGFSKRSDAGKKFLDSIKMCNLKTVEEDLKNNPGLTSLITHQGVSTVEAAVKSGLGMVEVFLKQSTQIKEETLNHAILYAVKHNDIPILEYLLHERESFWNHSSKPINEKYQTWKEIKRKSIWLEDAEYSPCITPIVLAAKLDRLDAVKLLLEYGASDIHPLTIKQCPDKSNDCEICSGRETLGNKKILEDSNRLLEVYRALSSPTYILHTSVEDPILEAFCISNKMHQMQEDDPSFKVEYEAIAKKCRLFATELLDLCRTTSEVEVLLKRDVGVLKVNSDGDQTEFPRVLVSLYYKQIEFLAHSYSQEVLQSTWYDGLPICCKKSKSNFFNFLKWLFYGLFWPVFSLLFIFRPCEIVLFMRKPINRFIINTMSKLTFLMFVVLTISLHEEGRCYFAPQECVLIAWLIGLTCRHIKLLWRQRHWCKWCKCLIPVSYVNRNICWFDLFILACFWLWAFLQIPGFVWNSVEFIPRMKWHSFHPTLFSEAFFAIGSLLSFIRLTSLLKVSHLLGLLQVSLTRMISDTVRFIFIFGIVLTGYVVATTSIYSHYKGSVHMVNGKEILKQNSNFIRIKNSYKTLFWDIFGYGELGDADVVINNTYTETSNASSGEVSMGHDYQLTELVGYFLVASYYIVATVILMNMLIAMLATSYNTIAENADNEWKFARVRLWMTYYTDVGSLPPPFNIIPTGWIAKQYGGCREDERKCCETCLPQEYKKQSNDEYMNLTENLSKRYWNRRNKEEERQIVISPQQLENILKDHRQYTIKRSKFSSCLKR